ncbi:MAG: MopE-related protein [Bradymonadia bacterium]
MPNALHLLRLSVLFAVAVSGCSRDPLIAPVDLVVDFEHTAARIQRCIDGPTPGEEAACVSTLSVRISTHPINACLLVQRGSHPSMPITHLPMKLVLTEQGVQQLSFAEGAPGRFPLEVGESISAELYVFGREAQGETLCVAGGLEQGTVCGPDGPCLLKWVQPILPVPAEGLVLSFTRDAESDVCQVQGSLLLAGEVCNGVDDDCDTLVDEGELPGVGGNCSAQASGPCGPGRQQCIEGRLRCVSTMEPLDRDLCGNNTDDDCDGRIDEADPQVVFTPTEGGPRVGLGESCQTADGCEGVTLCAEGGAELMCGPDPSAEEICNGADDDCDGRVDEQIEITQVTCGVGACAASGVRVCNGQLEDVCTPGEPALDDRNCDGIDDDCDGQADEDYTVVPLSCGLGACAQSTMTQCLGGEVINTCEPLAPLAADDSCNGIDEDCDGLVDEGFRGGLTTCGVGLCERQGQSFCQSGVFTDTCAPGDPAADTTCNGIDEDCDGQSDEDFEAEDVTCGRGICARQGQRLCREGGELRVQCTPGDPAGQDDNCNAMDDDCDGLVDEGFESELVACGQGACAAQGITRCVNGTLGDTCRAGEPQNDDDTCDGVDDDCDGALDEDYQAPPITCGLGICHREGLRVCVSGQPQDACDPGEAAPNDAICNGQDDDCDGQIDEDFVTQLTRCGQGICSRIGQRRCEDGVVLDTCVPGEPEPSDLTCDGRDDDCNGLRDDGYVPEATTCGVGDCSANGQTICVNGDVQSTCVPGQGAAIDATCDGDDDDCDGLVDEDHTPTPTQCGVGICQAQGQQLCVGGELVNTCTPQQPDDSDDDCNALDNDCDGLVDEGYGEEVDCGAGACATNGVLICTNGQSVSTCQPGDPQDSDSTCDGVDDDCDGALDEDFAPQAITCGQGLCTANGTRVCINGEISNACTPGTPFPGDETCDGQDDDCDGQPDEDYNTAPIVCGLGACLNQGQRICEGGQVLRLCDPLPPSDDICDGVDNDCDGETDEDFPTLGQPCVVGVGECARSGVKICSANGNEIWCSVQVGDPSEELCDGLDNDCDGETDEDPLGEGRACNADARGVCANGTSVCEEGALNCEPGTPSPEVCNRQDDNCDGIIDNVDPGTGLDCTNVGRSPDPQEVP